MTPGTHGSTFGGNPLAMAAAATVLDVVADEGFWLMYVTGQPILTRRWPDYVKPFRRMSKNCGAAV